MENKKKRKSLITLYLPSAHRARKRREKVQSDSVRLTNKLVCHLSPLELRFLFLSASCLWWLMECWEDRGSCQSCSDPQCAALSYRSRGELKKIVIWLRFSKLQWVFFFFANLGRGAGRHLGSVVCHYFQKSFVQMTLTDVFWQWRWMGVRGELGWFQEPPTDRGQQIYNL